MALLVYVCIGNRMGPSKIKVQIHACFQSFTICETLKTQVKLFYEEPMRLPVNHMQGKIYINIICYKRELRFECELQV